MPITTGSQQGKGAARSDPALHASPAGNDPRPEPAPEPETPEQLCKRLAARYRVPGLAREDVEQEAALALLLALPCPPGVEPGAYLHNRITARLSRLARRAARRAARESPLGERAAPDGPEMAGLAELARRHLPPRRARVLELTAEGRTDGEIAACLGSSPAAVRAARCRGVARLREEVADYGC